MKDNVVKTDFGMEITWADTEDYCSKILIFEKQGSLIPLHFHKSKKKSWFVNSGSFRVQWIDTADGKIYAQDLVEGSVFHVNLLQPVSLESLSNNSVIAETSNAVSAEDFYRLGNP